MEEVLAKATQHHLFEDQSISSVQSCVSLAIFSNKSQPLESISHKSGPQTSQSMNVRKSPNPRSLASLKRAEKIYLGQNVEKPHRFSVVRKLNKESAIVSQPPKTQVL
jgi:hypothetical protein